MTVVRDEPAAVVRDLRSGPIGVDALRGTAFQGDAFQGAFKGDAFGSDPFGVGEQADWQERALCAQTDPESFFPEKGGSTREAKKICTGCEVRSECLEYALGHDERFGIWGGLSERERRRLKKPAV